MVAASCSSSQPCKPCSRSWKATILTQRSELEIAMTRTLEQHAREILPKAYRTAVRDIFAEGVA